MSATLPGAFSSRLKEISNELREIDLALKAGASPELRTCRNFGTCWIVPVLQRGP